MPPPMIPMPTEAAITKMGNGTRSSTVATTRPTGPNVPLDFFHREYVRRTAASGAVGVGAGARLGAPASAGQARQRGASLPSGTPQAQRAVTPLIIGAGTGVDER